MKVCDRCKVPGCLLDYGGKACRNARKQECPDVVFTKLNAVWNGCGKARRQTMPEYIAKSVAIARLTALEIGNPCATIEDARRTIADTRPADVDTVTRCKDCEKSGVTEFGKRYCKEPMGCFCGCIPMEDDYFCSGGRRKDGAE